MTDFVTLLRRLDAHKVRFILIGGVAATVHGSARLTEDLDVLYERTLENIERLTNALAGLEPYLRGAPSGLPFRWNTETVRRGLNLTLTTTIGDLDLLRQA